MHQHKIVEEIHYPSGGILQIYSNGEKNYKPSQRYFIKKEKLKLSRNYTPKQRIILHNRRKLLFTENRCISGEILLDKLFKVHEVFDSRHVKIM